MTHHPRDIIEARRELERFRDRYFNLLIESDAAALIDEALGEIQKSEVLAEGALIEALCQSSYNPSGEFGTINKVSTGVK